jgi:hypothetical protein
MASWRDSASQQCQDDLDGLLNVALPFAQQMLAKGGEFYPFAAAVTAGGETRLTAPEPGQDDQPASATVLSSLFGALRQDRADLRAVAVCSDVRLPDSDAVRVELEHRDGQTMAACCPTGRSGPAGESTTASFAGARPTSTSGRNVSDLPDPGY